MTENQEPIKEKNFAETNLFVENEIEKYQKGLTDRKFELEDFKKGIINNLIYKIRMLSFKTRKHYFTIIIK